MGLRCSLLGHAYGEAAVERDRDDRGDEVVVTVREVKTCERCGAETVVSENTEVRPVEPMPEEGGADRSEPDATEGATGSVDDEFDAPASAADDDGVILEDEGEAGAEVDRDAGEWPDADDTRAGSGDDWSERDDASAGEQTTLEEGAAPEDDETAVDADATEADADEDDAADPDEDGIIDAEADAGEADADAGEWPDPGPGATDEGFDAEPDDDEAEVEMGGLTPTGVSDDGEADDADEPTVGGGVGTGIETAAGGRAGDDVDVDASFVCPACDYSESVIDSSLREGDICPECRGGYLAERSPTRN